jgi:hypothetical protein
MDPLYLWLQLENGRVFRIQQPKHFEELLQRAAVISCYRPLNIQFLCADESIVDSNETYQQLPKNSRLQIRFVRDIPNQLKSQDDSTEEEQVDQENLETDERQL